MSEQIEATVDDLIAKLESRLPAKLDAINAEHTDGIVLEHPKAITFGGRSEMQLPHIAVMPGATEPVSEASGRIHFNHIIAIATWISSPSEADLPRLLVRFQRAVREVVLFRRRPNETFADTPGGYGLQHLSDEYGEPFEAADIMPGMFLTYATSEFAVQQQQDIP
jgi:hypothetical protein